MSIKTIDKAILCCDKTIRYNFVNYSNAVKFCKEHKIDLDEIDKNDFHVDVEEKEFREPIIYKYKFEIYQAFGKEYKYKGEETHQSDKKDKSEAKTEFNRYVKNKYGNNYYVINIRRV